MMKIWKKTGSYGSVEDVILRKSGQTLRELQNPAALNPGYVEHIEHAAWTVQAALAENRPIWIVGDYDADGVTATAILCKLFSFLGFNASTIIPKRFSDGYGVSTALVAGVRDSLLITVDNGITAIDAIAAAKSAGNTVVILDHHLPGAELPPADVIVDPHLPGDQSLYRDYCGAGLAYKLAEYMCMGRKRADISQLFTDLTVLAALGTLADVVPLTGDNRRIVKAGLSILNNRKSYLKLSAGIRTIIALAEPPYDEESISYTIAPVINAAGRLYNAGSTSTLKALLSTNQRDAVAYAGMMCEINDKRKQMVRGWTEAAFQIAVSQADNPILTIYLPGIPEGIIGIVAGKLTEEFKRPAFVFCKAVGGEGIIKGSGRSYGVFDLSKALDAVRSLTKAAGGHAGAAGLTAAEKDLPALCSGIQEFGRTHAVSSCEDALLYDLEIREEDIPALIKKLKALAPFGEGVEKPVFVIQRFHCSNRFGHPFKMMGRGKEHIRLKGTKCDAVGFGLAGVYARLGYPETIDLLGTVGENTYHGSTSLQFQILDMRLPA